MNTFLQTLFNGLIVGSMYGLAAAGFNIVYVVHRFFFIAYGALVTVSGYAFSLGQQRLGLSWPVAGVFSLSASLLLALLLELVVHRSLRRRKATRLLMFLGSTAALVLIQNSLLIAFGPGSFSAPYQPVSRVELQGAIITVSQIRICFLAVLSIIALTYFFQRTSVGISLRAVADDENAAPLVGIDPRQARLWATLLSGVTACVVGALYATESLIRFDFGTQVILYGVLAALLGGSRWIAGAVIGGIALGVMEHAGVMLVGSWGKQVVPLAAIVFILAARPADHNRAGLFPESRR